MSIVEATQKSLAWLLTPCASRRVSGTLPSMEDPLLFSGTNGKPLRARKIAWRGRHSTPTCQARLVLSDGSKYL
jgi:hypothetical protein